MPQAVLPAGLDSGKLHAAHDEASPSESVSPFVPLGHGVGVVLPDGQ